MDPESLSNDKRLLSLMAVGCYPFFASMKRVKIPFDNGALAEENES